MTSSSSHTVQSAEAKLHALYEALQAGKEVRAEYDSIGSRRAYPGYKLPKVGGAICIRALIHPP